MDTYDSLKAFYATHFSLGYINGPFSDKLMLISLICYVTKKAKEKLPTTTHYQIVKKLTSGMQLSEDFLVGLSVVCEDFAYGCTEFPTFGLVKHEIIQKIRDVLNNYMPF